jgi:hypothetical protein
VSRASVAEDLAAGSIGESLERLSWRATILELAILGLGQKCKEFEPREDWFLALFLCAGEVVDGLDAVLRKHCAEVER